MDAFFRSTVSMDAAEDEDDRSSLGFLKTLWCVLFLFHASVHPILLSITYDRHLIHRLCILKHVLNTPIIPCNDVMRFFSFFLPRLPCATPPPIPPYSCSASSTGDLVLADTRGAVRVSRDPRRHLLASTSNPPTHVSVHHPQPELDFSPHQTVVSRSGRRVAVAGHDPVTSHAALVVLDLARTDPIRRTVVGGVPAPMTSSSSNPSPSLIHEYTPGTVVGGPELSRPGLRIAHVAWHPESDHHLLVLTTVGGTVPNFFMYHVGGDPTVPELAMRVGRPRGPRGTTLGIGLGHSTKKHNSTRSVRRQARYDAIVTFVCGGGSGGSGGGGSLDLHNLSGSSRAQSHPHAGPSSSSPDCSPWAKYAVHFLTAGGEVLTVCPVCPRGAVVGAGEVMALQEAAGDMLDADDAQAALAWLASAEQRNGGNPKIPTGITRLYPGHDQRNLLPAVQGPLLVHRALEGTPELIPGDTTHKTSSLRAAPAEAMLLLRYHLCTALVLGAASGEMAAHVLAGDVVPRFSLFPPAASSGISVTLVPSTQSLMLIDTINMTLAIPRRHNDDAASSSDDDDNDEDGALSDDDWSIGGHFSHLAGGESSPSHPHHVYHHRSALATTPNGVRGAGGSHSRPGERWSLVLQPDPAVAFAFVAAHTQGIFTVSLHWMPGVAAYLARVVAADAASSSALPSPLTQLAEPGRARLEPRRLNTADAMLAVTTGSPLAGSVVVLVDAAGQWEACHPHGPSAVAMAQLDADAAHQAHLMVTDGAAGGTSNSLKHHRHHDGLAVAPNVSTRHQATVTERLDAAYQPVRNTPPPYQLPPEMASLSVETPEGRQALAEAAAALKRRHGEFALLATRLLRRRSDLVKEEAAAVASRTAEVVARVARIRSHDEALCRSLGRREQLMGDLLERAHLCAELLRQMPGPLSEEEKRIDRALDILETVRGGGVGSSVNITSNMTSIAPHTRGSGTRATTRPAALPVLAELEHRVRQARGGAALLARRTQVRTGAGAGAGSGRDPTPVTSVETRVTGPTMSFRSYMRGVGAGGGPRGGGRRTARLPRGSGNSCDAP